MDNNVRIFRIFIASPSDLGAERIALREIIKRLDDVISKEADLGVQLLAWEDTIPGSGRPQALINLDVDRADLFIGCLGKKMGSFSGSHGLTGFEEEFRRASERSEKTGAPEMWMFFKDVDISDPGDELKKVIKFKEELKQAKKLLYKEFKDTADWGQIINDLLLRQIWRWSANRFAQNLQAQSVVPLQAQNAAYSDSTSQPASTELPDKGREALVTILEKTKEGVGSKTLPSFSSGNVLEQIEVIRLALFAASNYHWQTEKTQFGVHECNSVFWYRKSITPSSPEQFFLIRTLLLDQSMTRPGWYWASEFGRRFEYLLCYFALSDSEEFARKLAISVAAKAGIRLRSPKRTFKVIVSELLKEKSEGIRSETLNYLMEVGGTENLKAIEKLFADQSADIRVKAELTAKIILLKTDPNKFLKRSAIQNEQIDGALMKCLEANEKTVGDETLMACLESHDEDVRSFGAKKLFERRAIKPEMARKMTSDSAKSVKEKGYIALVAHDQAIDLENAVKELDANSSSNEPAWNKADAGALIEAYMEKLDVLSLWDRVYEYDANSSKALAVLGDKYYNDAVDSIRNAIRLKFDHPNYAKKLAKYTPLDRFTWSIDGFLKKTPESIKAILEELAVEILAEHPIPEDRNIYLENLSSDAGKSNLTQCCLQALAKVGHESDKEAVKPFIASDKSGIAFNASCAYFNLSSNPIAALKEIVHTPTKARVSAAVIIAVEQHVRKPWEIFEPFLQNDDEDIRRIVAYYAVSTFNRRKLLNLLDKYITQGRYYYNVVVLLDKALFAPECLRRKFLSDEAEFVSTWRSRNIDPNFSLSSLLVYNN